MPTEVVCQLNVLVADLDDPGLLPALDLLADLGYSHVVLPPFDPDSAPMAMWRALLSSHGLAPVTLALQGPGADVSSADQAEREAGLASLRRMAEATADLGGDQMNGVPYGLFGKASSAPADGTVQRAAELVGQVADHAHDLGVTMTFEVLNRYETPLLNTAGQALEFIADSGSDHLRVHLDTFHMAIEETDMLEAVRSTVPVLGYLELGQSGRGSLVSGSVDPGAVVRAALEAGYRGRIGVEAFTRQLLPAALGDGLAIWRSAYSDPGALVAEAIAVVRAAEAAVPHPQDLPPFDTEER